MTEAEIVAWRAGVAWAAARPVMLADLTPETVISYTVTGPAERAALARLGPDDFAAWAGRGVVDAHPRPGR